MTNNIDRAAEIIGNALADDADVSIAGNYTDITTISEATLDGKYDLTAVACALADAGLLAPDLSTVTRITVAGGGKRQMEEWNLHDVELHIQDEGRTLKIFYRTDATQEKK